MKSTDDYETVKGLRGGQWWIWAVGSERGWENVPEKTAFQLGLESEELETAARCAEQNYIRLK